MKGQRKAVDTEREIRKELIAHWADRPVASIAREDVIALVEAIARRPAPYTAHIVLGHARSLFNRISLSVSTAFRCPFTLGPARHAWLYNETLCCNSEHVALVGREKGLLITGNRIGVG